MFDLDYPTIHAAWNTYPRERVHYSDDETGWAVRLDAQHVCIANVPLADHLFQFDVCVCPAAHAGDRPPPLGPVVQRYFTQRAFVVYEYDGGEETSLLAQYRDFTAALQEAGCACEGMIEGMAQVQGPAAADLSAVIVAAAAASGLELRKIEVVEAAEEGEEEA